MLEDIAPMIFQLLAVVAKCIEFVILIDQALKIFGGAFVQGVEFIVGGVNRPAKILSDNKRYEYPQNIFEIGKFYFRTGSYQSAIIRLKSLMVEYPTHSYVAEAEFLLAESYFHEQNYSKARDHYKIVLQKHSRTEFAKQARIKLIELKKL